MIGRTLPGSRATSNDPSRGKHLNAAAAPGVSRCRESMRQSRESARARRRDWVPLAAELAAMSKGGMRITVGELCRLTRSGVAVEAMLTGAKAAQDSSGMDAVQSWAATLEGILRRHGLRSDGALH